MKLNSNTIQAISLTGALISSNVQAIESVSKLTLTEQQASLSKVCAILDKQDKMVLPENICEVSSDGGETWIPYTAGSIAAIMVLLISGALIVRVRRKENDSTPFTARNMGEPKVKNKVLPPSTHDEGLEYDKGEEKFDEPIIDNAAPQQIDFDVPDDREGQESKTDEPSDDSLFEFIPEEIIEEKSIDTPSSSPEIDLIVDDATEELPITQEEGDSESKKDTPVIPDIPIEDAQTPTEDALRMKRLAKNTLDEESKIKRSSGDMMDIYVTTHLKKRGITFTNNVNEGIITLNINKDGSGIYFLNGTSPEFIGKGEEYRIVGAKKLNFRQLDKKPCIEIVYPDYSTETIEIVDV